MQNKLLLSQRWLNKANRSFLRRAPQVSVPEELPATLDSLRSWALCQAGQFAGVRIGENGEVFLVADFARSIPLLFTYLEDAWVISDSAEKLRTILPAWKLSKESAEHFASFGFVVGTNTLVKDVYQLPAASIVKLVPGDAEPHFCLYHRFQYVKQRIADEKEFVGLFHAALERAIQDVILRQGDKKIAVPLSGGIDSRLLVALLREYDAANVLTFTYGMSGSKEMQISREIAERAGFPWRGVEIDPAALRKAWQAEGEEFLRFAWGGASLPHYQDWYALRELRRERVLGDGDIILPGHTIVGNLYDWTPETTKSHYSFADLTQIIVNHYKNSARKPEPKLLSALAAPLADFAAEIEFSEEHQDMQSWLEWFNVRERQAKYINNSMRAYEYFDLDFALPMLDIDVVRAWEQGSYTFTDLERSWYRKYVSALYTEVCRKKEQKHLATVEALDGVIRDVTMTTAMAKEAAENTSYYGESRYNAASLSIRIWRWANRHFSIAAPLDRVKSVRAQLRHPMAFHALLPEDASIQTICKLLAGSTLQSEFIRLFLSNKWIAGAKIVPEE